MLVPGVARDAERVAPGHVRHLVADDHRQLCLVIESGQEAGVQVDPAVGQREGVQGRVAHDGERERRASGFADVLRHELVADPGEVLVEERVVVRLEPLLDLRFFLVGLVPQTDFVGLGREGLFGARRGQETDEGEPRDRAAGDARGAAPHQFRSARV